MEKAQPSVHVCALQCVIHAHTIRSCYKWSDLVCTNKLVGLVFLQNLKGGNIVAGTICTGILLHSSLMTGHEMQWKGVLHKLKLFLIFMIFL
jgi:hypothetical protein